MSERLMVGRTVISLRQPWATLLAAGVKRYETRSWPVGYRGRILIHASKKIDRQYLARPDVAMIAMTHGLTAFPTGAIVGEGVVAGCLPTAELADLLPEQELLLGDFGPERFAWAFREARLWSEPVPCRGRLGIWTVREGDVAGA